MNKHPIRANSLPNEINPLFEKLEQIRLCGVLQGNSLVDVLVSVLNLQFSTHYQNMGNPHQFQYLRIISRITVPQEEFRDYLVKCSKVGLRLAHFSDGTQKQIKVQQSSFADHTCINIRKQRKPIIYHLEIWLGGLQKQMTQKQPINACSDRQDSYLIMNLINSPPQQNQVLDIWLDCDPGLDDCFAIILAAAHPRFNLLGVSTTSGNSTIQNTTKNALDLLSIIGKSHVPVYMGARTPISKGSKLGDETHGTSGLGGVELIASKVVAFLDNTFELMLQKIMGNKNKVAFICTGALTNLALMMKISPKVKEHISILSLMGGAFGLGNVTPAAQFNIYFDPLAAQMVFSSGLQIAMIPLEVTHTALCNQVIRQKMNLKKSSLSTILMNMVLTFQLAYQREEGFLDPPLHDPCAVFYLLEPHQFEVKRAKVDIDLYPSSFGRTNCDFRSKQPNTTVCVKMNVDRFWEVMLSAYEYVVPDV